MSFALQVKTELCLVRTSRCCSLAQCYGMLLFAKRFSSAEISLQTENVEVAELFVRLCSQCFGVRTRIIQGGIKRDVYIVSVISAADRKKIMLAYGCNDGKRPSSINFDIIKKECCKSAFLRGAFISCGGVSDPDKTYHARFIVKDRLLANDLYNLLKKCGMPPKVYAKDNSVHLYYKESRLIEELFTVIDATKNAMVLMDAGVVKTVTNKLNRQDNCMMANMDKTVEASVRQRKAIKLLVERGIFNDLAADLQQAAKLRTDNPESSLTELCRLWEGDISRSALSRKLTRLTELADNLSR